MSLEIPRNGYKAPEAGPQLRVSTMRRRPLVGLRLRARYRSLNEQVKRNLERFPGDFMFQLSAKEATALRSQFATSSGLNQSQIATGSKSRSILKSQIATSSSHGGRRSRPCAFTEYGALMAANVLNSERAVQMSVFVIRAFVKMRETLLGTRELAKKLALLEKKLPAGSMCMRQP
jgi:hypothetical protein